MLVRNVIVATKIVKCPQNSKISYNFLLWDQFHYWPTQEIKICYIGLESICFFYIYACLQFFFLQNLLENWFNKHWCHMSKILTTFIAIQNYLEILTLFYLNCLTYFSSLLSELHNFCPQILVRSQSIGSILDTLNFEILNLCICSKFPLACHD